MAWAARWERHHPAVFGGLGVLAYGAVGTQAMSAMVGAGYDAPQMYSATFDVASVFTAFLFTYYSFVVTSGAGFISRMRKTRAYALLKEYTISALSLGVLLVVVSIPLTIIKPKPIDFASLQHLMVTAWAGVTCWSISAFVRATRFFVAFARYQD